jgi:hypothetical protein
MKILTGGQNGVDRAALDAAITCGLACGGWCPNGGGAEDFPDPPGLLARYPACGVSRLTETHQFCPFYGGFCAVRAKRRPSCVPK